MLPIIATKNPSTMGSPFSPERVARWWTPTPRAPADNIASILFKTFPRVAPTEDWEKIKKKTSQMELLVPILKLLYRKLVYIHHGK